MSSRLGAEPGELMEESAVLFNDFDSADLASEVDAHARTLQRLVAQSTVWEAKVRSDVRECLGKGGELNTRFSPANNVVSGPLLAQQLASSLRSRGYHAHAHGGGAATSAEMSLSNCHTFVSIDPLSCSDEPTVVEPQFKQMFLCGRSTSWYNQLLCEVPEVFVCSSASRMRTLVRFLAERMAETLHCAGLDVPPWRRPGNMLSMWNLKTPPPVSECKAPAAVLQLTQQHQCGTGIAAPTPAAKLKPVKPR